jgi:alpha,alpha-trehalose phosphorylase (configuration-retaining)
MKFVGAGVTSRLVEYAPKICGRLWRELDIVPIVFHVRSTQRLHPGRPVAKLDDQGFPVHDTGLLTPLPQDRVGSGGYTATGAYVQSNLLSVAAGAAQTQAQAQAKAQAAADASAPVRPADEQADSAVRKAVMYFGPSGHNPRLTIGFRSVHVPYG